MEGITIRKARKEDMKSVMNLIKELAAFEKKEDQVMIDEKQLEKDGFETENPAFSCIVAEDEKNNTVGYALTHFPYSTWMGKSLYLEDLFVEKSHRRRGIGTALFKAVAREAYDSKMRLQFSVLAWNPARNFYEKMGAVNLTDTKQWNLYVLDEHAQKRLFNN